jgi:uncharacterized protein (UPF0335 family)
MKSANTLLLILRTKSGGTFKVKSVSKIKKTKRTNTEDVSEQEAVVNTWAYDRK